MFISKKVGIILAAVLIAGAGLFGQSEIYWGSNYAVGNTVFGGAAAYETNRSYYTGKALALYPSAEMILWKPIWDGYAPFDFGAVAEGRLGLPLNRDSELTAGLGLEGSFHLGFMGMNFPGSEYLDRVDLYARIGLSFDLIKPSDANALGLAASSGINYFFDDRLMAGISYTSWGSGSGGYDGVALNIRYRMGKNFEVRGMGDTWKTYETEAETRSVTQYSMIYLNQFYAFYVLAVYSGGYYWVPDAYETGEGTLWRYTESGEEPFYIERILLERTTDGGEWWSLRYYDDRGDEFLFEYYLNGDLELEILYYRDDGGETGTYYFDEEDRYSHMDSRVMVSYEELESMSAGRETVTVPAGTFRDCLLVSHLMDDATMKWWFSPDERVIGSLVKFHHRTDDNITAELAELIVGKEGAFVLK